MVFLLINFEIEAVKLKDIGDMKTLKLPKLTKEEINIVNPIVAPTSGLRMQIFDVQEIKGKTNYFLPNRKLFLFLRVFKAISQKFSELKRNKNLNVLIVTDDRPSKDILLNYCSQIFAFDGYQIYFQKDKPGESKISSPYGHAERNK